MKRLLGILIFCATLTAVAQPGHRGNERQQQRRQFEDLTAEQIADLQTKRMTIALDLSTSQQKKVYDLQLGQAEKMKSKQVEFEAKRKAGQRPEDMDPSERYQKESERLDNEIAYQQSMRQILNEQQYETFKELKQKRKMAQGRKRMLRDGRSR